MMTHYFRVIYHTDEDTRRHTTFFAAEEYPAGFKMYFPAEFTAKNIHLESVSIFDEALIPSPLPQPKWEDLPEDQRKRIEQMARDLEVDASPRAADPAPPAGEGSEG